MPYDRFGRHFNSEFDPGFTGYVGGNQYRNGVLYMGANGPAVGGGGIILLVFVLTPFLYLATFLYVVFECYRAVFDNPLMVLHFLLRPIISIPLGLYWFARFTKNALILKAFSLLFRLALFVLLGGLLLLALLALLALLVAEEGYRWIHVPTWSMGGVYAIEGWFGIGWHSFMSIWPVIHYHLLYW